MQGLTEPFLTIVGCCNFTEAKSREVCTGLLDKGLFLKKQTMLATKHSIWLSSMLKIVDLEYLFAVLGCLDGHILVQKFTKFDYVCITDCTR